MNWRHSLLTAVRLFTSTVKGELTMSNVIARTAKQTAYLTNLEVPSSQWPADAEAASRLIDATIAQRENAPATPAQLGLLGANCVYSKFVAGVGKREASTMCLIMKILADYDAQEDPAMKQIALLRLESELRNRLQDPAKVAKKQEAINKLREVVDAPAVEEASY